MKCVACVLLMLCATTALSQPSFQTIGYIPGGSPVSQPTGVSADGEFVVGFSNFQTFRWTVDNGFQVLPIPKDGTTGSPEGISPSGNFVFGSYAAFGGTAPGDFVWSEKNGSVYVPSLPGGNELTTLWHINDQGVAVGYSSVGFTNTGASLNRAVRWTQDEGLEAFPLPTQSDESEQSVAIRTLSDGRVYGSSASGVWFYSEDTGFEFIENLPVPLAMNSDGTFAAGAADNPITGQFTPAYWTPFGGVQFLGLLDNDQIGLAVGMSDDGSIIVGQSGSTHVVWIDQNEPLLVGEYATSLGIDMKGWNITGARCVSADGTTIVGTARHDDWGIGHLETFVLTIPAMCLADVNNDGHLNPTDFTAWVASFNAGAKTCDQNGDGECSPTDFTAWVANYNAGCGG